MSGDVIILNLCNKKYDHMMYAYSDMECDRHMVMYGSWDLKCKSHLGLFLSFDSPKHPKNQNFEKIIKLLEILSFCTFVPQMMIIWCIITEISSTTDRIFCHSGHLPYYPPNNPENENFENMKKSPEGIIILNRSTIKWKSYDVWFLRYGARQTEFILILDHFLLFYIPSPPL